MVGALEIEGGATHDLLGDEGLGVEAAPLDAGAHPEGGRATGPLTEGEEVEVAQEAAPLATGREDQEAAQGLPTGGGGGHVPVLPVLSTNQDANLDPVLVHQCPEEGDLVPDLQTIVDGSAQGLLPLAPGEVGGHLLTEEVLTPSGVRSASPPPLVSDETALPTKRHGDPPTPPLPLGLPPHPHPPGPLRGQSQPTPPCPHTSDQSTTSPQAVVSQRTRRKDQNQNPQSDHRQSIHCLAH